MFLTEGIMVYVSRKEQDKGGTKHDVWTLSLSFISKRKFTCYYNIKIDYRLWKILTQRPYLAL
jgi:hypothetical protein